MLFVEDQLCEPGREIVENLLAAVQLDGHRQGPLRLGKIEIPPGRRRKVELPVARLPTDTWLSLPVMAVNGLSPASARPKCRRTFSDTTCSMNPFDAMMRVLSSAIDAASMTPLTPPAVATTSPPRRSMAAWNDMSVRVLASKKSVAMMRRRHSLRTD